jgi:O-Antigen ligase
LAGAPPRGSGVVAGPVSSTRAPKRGGLPHLPDPDTVASGQEASAIGGGWRAALSRQTVAWLPSLLVVALLLVMTPFDGAFAPTSWYPAAIFVLGLLVAVAAGASTRLFGPPRASWVAIGALTAFTAWSYASIAWADSRGDAWDGANRTLFYLLVYTLCARWLSSARTAVVAILALGSGLAAIGLFEVLRVVVSDDPAGVFSGERLWAPLGYPNATAALFMLACWPVAGLASRRWLAPSARVLAFAVAALLAHLSLLAESRGSVYTLPLVAAVYLAIVPGRLRSLVTFGVLAVCIAPAVGPVLNVYSSDSDAELVDRTHVALAVMLATTLGAALAGALVVWLDRTIDVSPWIRRLAWAGVGLFAVIGVVTLLAVRSPGAELDRAWTSFRHDGPPTSEGSHFGGFGSNRYDIWRVGLEEFRDHPLTGIGADNFAIPYVQARRGDEEPLYPHSLAVRLLAQTGIVGCLLFVAFLGFALAAALAVRGEASRDVARLAVVGFAVWLLQAQVDWLWEMPVLGGGAAGGLGVVGGLARRASPEPAGVPAPGRRGVRLAFGGVAVCAAALTLALPWLSARDADRAVEIWRTDPDTADSLLARARVLNPLSERPDMLRGILLSRQGRYDEMRQSFARAVARSPSSWYANFELGVAYALTGRRSEALGALEAARRLNPRDRLVAEVAGNVRRGREVEPDEIDRRLLERLTD